MSDIYLPLSPHTHTHTAPVCEYRFHPQLHKYRKPSQLDAIELRWPDGHTGALTLGGACNPLWISRAAPLTHIPRPDSQDADCPLMECQRTAVNNLTSEDSQCNYQRAKYNKGESESVAAIKVHWYHVCLEQINTEAPTGNCWLLED